MRTITMSIGVLLADVTGTGLGGARFDTAVASEFDVEVGYVAPEVEGIVLACEVKSIRASANIHLEGELADIIVKRGAQIMPLFTGVQVDKLADEILAAIKKGLPDD